MTIQIDPYLDPVQAPVAYPPRRRPVGTWLGEGEVSMQTSTFVVFAALGLGFAWWLIWSDTRGTIKTAKPPIFTKRTYWESYDPRVKFTKTGTPYWSKKDW